MNGYEIHKGKTVTRNLIFEDDGCASDDGMVWGTYLHGLFSNDNVLNALMKYLGLKFEKPKDWIKEFANILNQHIDIKYILKLLNLY